jgi:hypothetical protein
MAGVQMRFINDLETGRVKGPDELLAHGIGGSHSGDLPRIPISSQAAHLLRYVNI